MKRPNFFIIGAPKSGTTSFHHYLRQHPDVFMSSFKEPHFFAPDHEPDERLFFRDEAAYLDLFSEADAQKWVGEASVFYLYSHEAAWRLKKFDPQAKLIAMLREPVDMMYSLHAQHLSTALEDITDFEAAINAEDERREGRLTSRQRVNQKWLWYRSIARYGEQIERFLNLFPREQLHVIAFDDFRRDPAKVYREALRFLEVDEEFLPELQVVNPGKRVRSMVLRDFLSDTPDWAVRMGRLAFPWERGRRLFQQRAWAWNTPVVARRPPMNPSLRARLEEEVAPDIELLSNLTGRDFCALWQNCPSKTSSPR